MAKKSYVHVVDSKGKPKIVEQKKHPVRGMRGIDPEYDVHSFTEGPIARLLSRKKK